jgi:hypothetical protein
MLSFMDLIINVYIQAQCDSLFVRCCDREPSLQRVAVLVAKKGIHGDGATVLNLNHYSVASVLGWSSMVALAPRQ